MAIVRAHNVVPSEAYREFKQLCVRLDMQCAEWTAMLSGNVTADDVWLWYRELYWYNTRFNEIAAIPGIVDYALAQENDPTYDLIGAFVTLISALSAAHVWLYAAIPRDPVTLYTLTHTTTVEGERIPAVYIPTQTAAFIPYLTSIAASIE